MLNRIGNTIWELIPKQGIRQDEVEIFFGMARSTLRESLRQGFGEPASHMADEDDFETPDGATLIRLRFDGDKLQDIEFLRGSLRYRDIELHDNTRWSEVEERLGRLGLRFHESEFLGEGMECSELGANIATRAQIGGDKDDDRIEWVITSINFFE
jgi:hypothetical protein